jgi:hypothetical protein
VNLLTLNHVPCLYAQAQRLAAAGGPAADKAVPERATTAADGKGRRKAEAAAAEAAAATATKYLVKPKALPESTVEKVGAEQQCIG